jgi:hypothetical protein
MHAKHSKRYKKHENTHKNIQKSTKSIKGCFSYRNLKLVKFYYILFLPSFYLLKAIYKVSFGQIIKVCVKSKNISLSFSFFLDKTSFPLCIFDYFYLVCTKKLKIIHQKMQKRYKEYKNLCKAFKEIQKT